MKKIDFFKKMEEIRKILGLNQRDFAEKMSLNPNQYNDYQRSEGEISRQTIMLVALLFNLRKEWIEDLSDKKDPFLNKQEIDSARLAISERNKNQIELMRLIKKREGTEELIRIIIDLPTEDNEFIKEFLVRLKKMAKKNS
ncbi:MAG: helix-turn-helix transcriptional regulator [Leptospiraceae bacterium]|jgi:transcriptional regulator with XRE-family HTH domain|nr:helix-turn-helix transcriptional regulator [Leptospiraceae bacterium]